MTADRRCVARITRFGVTLRPDAIDAVRCDRAAMLGIHAQPLCAEHSAALAGHYRVIQRIRSLAARAVEPAAG